MCTLCQTLNPEITRFDFHGLEAPEGATADASGSGSTSLSSSLPTYTTDQIASYLTDGYWQDTGRSTRAFDVRSGDTLTVDLTGLGASGLEAARNALNAWSAASGLKFAEVGGGSAPTLTKVYESGDAGGSASTAQKMAVNQTFSGKIGFGGDKDWVAVQVTAGQTYSVSLKGAGSGAISDTVLQLYDAGGRLVSQNDDRASGDRSSALSFTAEKSGTYYVVAAGYGSNTGQYEMSVTQGRSNAAPDITFSENQSGAFSTSYVSGGKTTSATVNVDASWTKYGAYFQQTYIHEIGHALGLGHGGNYNGSASFSSAHYANDSYQMSVMSYFSQSANPNVNASRVDVSTPQLADVLAIQNLYGRPTTTRTGDTVYGDDANTRDFGMDLRGDRAATIVDSGGIDTINFSKRSAHQRLDLNSERFSDIDGRIGNLAIARGTVIENAVTGSGNDRIIGNAADNLLMGLGGNDTLIGNDGNDVLVGGAGSDVLQGGNGTDRAVFEGRAADYAIYWDASAANGGAVRIQQGSGATDTLSGIEKLDFGDTSIDLATLLGQLKAKYGSIAPGSSTSHKASLVQGASSNRAPDARDDAAATQSGKSVTLNVLGNDVDPDGDRLTVTGLDGSGLRGSVKLNADGTVTYSAGSAFADLPTGQSVTESFTYTVDDGRGGRDTARVTVRVDGTATAPQPVAPSEPVAPSTTTTASGQMEIGSTRVSQDHGDQWHRVAFAGRIEDAVVVMGPLSFNGGQSANVRVRNVTSGGFEFQIDEWDYLDGAHTAESVSWMAGSRGRHLLDDGTKITFGATQANGANAKSVALDGFDGTPRLFGQLADGNGSGALTHRIIDSGRDGFSFKVQAEEARGGDIGGKGTFYYAGIEAAENSSVFRGGLSSISHDAATLGSASGKAILADMQGLTGQDTASLRYALDGSGRLRLHVSEEQSADSEMKHASEKVAWFTATAGRYALTSDAASSSGGDTGTGSGSGTIDGTRMQIGTLEVSQANASEWHYVAFDAPIDNASVVMGPASFNGQNAMSIRVKDVTSKGFYFQLDEWDSMDGAHTWETISWMAGSAGSHRLTDGTKISFGSDAVSSLDGGKIGMSGFNKLPLLFGQFASGAEGRSLSHRIERLGSDGFDFRLDLEEAARGTSATGTWGRMNWAAIESNADSILFRAGTTASDDHFGGTISGRGNNDALFADMIGIAGHDTATLRYRQNGDKVSFAVHEELSRDDETTHLVEAIAWMTAGNGVYDLV